MTLKFKRLTPTAVPPRRATQSAAGFDLAADLTEPVELAPGERALIPTGLAVELPGREFAAFVYARSGLATKHGITLSNGVGVVDSDYRGEIKVGLINLSQTGFIVNHGDRIAQMVIAPVCLPEAAEVDELEETARGTGGFGSTGL
ncbi:MAG: dUTP diphosphatase [Oscillospiraceae bacterium]|jgi:dUTP pyrophosphatase|nr:dUTP diphosphatase [Oscillospiraceae bacterium]